MDKKRVLVVGEANYLKSGYGKINLEICSRLHNAGYTVGEFANYGHPGYPHKPKWAYYGTAPGTVWMQPVDKNEEAVYNSEPHNQFGKWRFNDVCLHFRPDVVLTFLDHWMSAYHLHGPFRNLYKYIWVPTVDGIAQNEQWIADYASCDSVLTYTNWAKKVLEEESGEKIIVNGIASPGVDNKIYSPINNKQEHKSNMGLQPNIKIVGTVMRNQRRKLFPDLFVAFKKFLEKCQKENDKLGQETFLYIHTSYPDLGWDLPRLIIESGLSHKVLVTYICINPQCKTAFPSFWQDTTAVCPRCRMGSCKLTSTQTAIPEEALGSIYNTFDVYLQYANREGLGMPAVEAAACGIPVITLDYAGPEDFKTTIAAKTVPYLCLNRESETHQFNASPDNNQLCERIFELLSMSEKDRRKIGFDARKGAIKNYNWDTTAKVLIESIEKLENGNWNSPPNIHNPSINEPENLNEKEFLIWAFINILGEPELINSYMFLQMLKNLTAGMCYNFGDVWMNEDSLFADRQKMKSCDRGTIKEDLLNIRNNKNHWEMMRCGNIWEMPYWMKVSLSK